MYSTALWGVPVGSCAAAARVTGGLLRPWIEQLCPDQRHSSSNQVSFSKAPVLAECTWCDERNQNKHRCYFFNVL